ncbi:DUF2637 domain-containing protein [Brevibacterium sp. 5221]|uniref:DUF2637 domain-containing protein n=1 Tax=Brevibacterium rongguiense TaxID=2695267 RepID=A0A6N9H7G1_9MICO|nr:DUF2637 domain-containing protein [Brevibacterium rongguiense]MYM19706.1 DUF2637 domain-containing protein [Brevibacterium rongguiense]
MAMSHEHFGADEAVATVSEEHVATAPESDGRAKFSAVGEAHSSGSTSQPVAPSAGVGKSSRINPDDPRFIRAITVGVAFAGLVAFAISFVALSEIAAWLGLPHWMHWAVPLFIDTGILVYAGSVLIHKARGERTWPSWLMLGTFTALSVVANAAHALSFGSAAAQSWQALVGAIIAGMVPVAVFTATEQLSRVAVEDPVSRRRELQALAEWHAQQAQRERKQLEMEAERERARQASELAKEEHLTRIAEVRAARELRAERAAKQLDSGQDRGLHLVAQSAPAQVGAAEAPDIDEVAEFVAERAGRGVDTSGADLAERFGFSAKTGRRRLAKLREERPEIFTGEEQR